MVGSRAVPWMLTCVTLGAGAYACSQDAKAVVSVHVSCRPALLDLQCQLIAMSPDVSRPARDVTMEATWALSPASLAHVVAPGLIERLSDGDVDIDAQYRSNRAHVMARLRAGAPPQLLGMVHGAA